MHETTSIAELPIVSKTVATRRKKIEWDSPIIFLLPALTIYAVFVLYPIASALWLSLYKWDGLSLTREFVGLNNYLLIAQDSVFWHSLGNTVIWTSLALTIPTSLGLLLAMILNLPLFGRTLFRTMFYLPAILATIVVAIMWTWMYHPTSGLINAMFKAVGLEILIKDWLGDAKIALLSVAVASVWAATGTNMLLFLAGLQRVPADLVEAARVDGADSKKVFWYVVVPSLHNTFIVVLSLTVINSLKVFDLIYAMTYGGPGQASQVLTTWSYFQAFNFHNFGTGMAIAMVLFFITLLLVVPYVLWATQEDSSK